MVQEDLNKIIIICGPTGIGKSAIALELARRFNGEIINADSQQVYRGLDIGTAKLTESQRLGIRHHLVDVVNLDESFDANKYVRLADIAINDIASRGKHSFIVGGTGMYLRMLLGGICSAPPRHPHIREKLEEEIKAQGLASLHDRLKVIDPISAKVVHKNDKIRIVRALEIFETTGITASEFYAHHGFAKKRYNALKIGINMDRQQLYERIDARVDQMLEKGWAQEVENLLEKYSPDCQAFSAIGYRELISYLKGEMPLKTAASVIKRHSRHYAKRQLTWFRSDRDIHWYDPQEIEKMAADVAGFLGSN